MRKVAIGKSGWPDNPWHVCHSILGGHPSPAGRAVGHRRRRAEDAVRPAFSGEQGHFQGLFVQGRVGGQLHRHHIPAGILRSDRFLFGGGKGAGHAIGEAQGEHGAVFRGAIVVFSSPDIASGPAEMDVQAGGHRLSAEKPGDSGKVRIGHSGAVITLRVGGKITEHGHRLLALPETEDLDQGIDQTLRGSAQHGVLAGGETLAKEFARLIKDPAVAGNFLDRRFSPAQMGHLDRSGQGRTDGVSHSLDQRAGDLRPEGTGIGAGFPQDAFGGVIADRGIVLMQGMQRDALGLGAGGLGMSAVQLARALGAADVIAVDRDPLKLALAERFGARTIRATELSPDEVVAQVRAMTQGRGVDVALELVGKPDTMRTALQSLAQLGRAVVVGLSDIALSVDTYRDLIGREAELIGSNDHLLSELYELVEMADKAGLPRPALLAGDRAHLRRLVQGLRALGRPQAPGHSVR